MASHPLTSLAPWLFAAWLLALGSASAANAQASPEVSPSGPDGSTPAAPAPAASGLEIRVEPELRPEAEARAAPRAQIERCLAGGVRRLPELGGLIRFQIRWQRDALVVVLRESVLGDHRTEACLRRAIESERRALRSEIARGDLVTVEIAAPTEVRLCHPDGSEVSSGQRIPECALPDQVRASAAAVRDALAHARVRRHETLEQSCGFTHVTAWIDARGRLVSYGASSVNSDGEDPALDEYVAERAAALRVLAARVRPRRGGSVPLFRIVFMLGGCD